MPHAHLCRITGLSSLWEVWMHEYQSILYPNNHTHTNCQIKALGINPRLLSGKPVMWCLKSYICTFWNIAGIELIPGILYRSQSSHVCTLVTEGVPQQWPQDWKRSVFIPVPKKGNAKECSNHRTIGLILHASKVMLEILQARLQQYVNCELPDIQAGFRKGTGTIDKIANIYWIIKKAREFQKNICFCFIDHVKAFDCMGHNKLENSERDGNTRPPDLPPEKSVCRSGSNS